MIYYGKTKDKYETGCDYGYVLRYGKALDLTEPATLNHNCEIGSHYSAIAVDNDGDQYRVVWDITNPDDGAEEHACNWNTYHVYHI